VGAGKISERIMGMSDEIWLRHANPLSGWTRFATMPVLFFAIWSHVWIGWYAASLVTALAIWLWLNPRVFQRPKNADAWMTKVVLGERVWLNRKSVPIPVGFGRHALLTSVLSALAIAIAIYGFVIKEFWAAFLGWHISVLAKLWFVDRMVWLWEIMKDTTPEYRNWHRTLGGDGGD